MKFISLVLIVVLSFSVLVISGCSQVGYEDRVKFCESKGMEYYDQGNGYFMCGVDDLDYVRESMSDCHNVTCCD